MTVTSHTNGPHFRSLALQHCNGMIAQIMRAEQCNPGCTGEAFSHAMAALDALKRGFRPPLSFPQMDPSSPRASTAIQSHQEHDQ